MLGHPPLYPPEIWRVDPLPLREGTSTLDTLQLAGGWFVLQRHVGNGKDGFQAIPEYMRFTVDVSLPPKSIVDFNP